MCLSIVGRHRPVLSDRNVGRNTQAVALAAFERGTGRVLVTHQPELAPAQPPRREEDVREQQSALVPRIAVRIGEILRQLGRQVLRCHEGPTGAGPERGIEQVARTDHRAARAPAPPQLRVAGVAFRPAQKACPSRCRSCAACRSSRGRAGATAPSRPPSRGARSSARRTGSSSRRAFLARRRTWLGRVAGGRERVQADPPAVLDGLREVGGASAAQDRAEAARSRCKSRAGTRSIRAAPARHNRAAG